MGLLRNIRHERFVMEYFQNGGSIADAYQAAYPGIPREFAYTRGRELFYRPDIRARSEEIRVAMSKRTEITVEKILTDYQLALDLAKEQGKPNEIVNAATAQAKLVGLMRDRVETGQPGDFERMDNISEILEAVAREAGPEAALALGKALGVGSEADQALSEAEAASDAVN